MGGRPASMSTTLGLGLAGAIPFYGWPTGENRNGTPAPADVADRIECDLLIFYGEKDEGITREVRDAFDEALDKAGVKHETVVYPGAPHGFFDRHFDEHADDSADAWNRTLTFIRRHTMGQPIAGSSAGAAERDARGPGAPRRSRRSASARATRASISGPTRCAARTTSRSAPPRGRHVRLNRKHMAPANTRPPSTTGRIGPGRKTLSQP